MSSLLLSRLSRLCLRKPRPALGVRGRYLSGSRFLSQTPIYRIVGADHCGYNWEDGSVGKLVVRNVNGSEAKDEVLEKMVPTVLMNGTIGGSHGWVATMDDYFVHLYDDLKNPGASDSDPKRISRRRPKTLPHCQTELVTNVAMSSSSPEDEDCILAIKFLGPQLSFCRPARVLTEWVNIRVDDPCFFESRVFYSERCNMFPMLASGGTYVGYWDLEKKDRSQTVYRSNLYSELNQCVMQATSNEPRTELLVEGPTGETLIVNWYAGVWKRFMVYKIDESYLGTDHIANFTNDIGDVCIFVSSKGQPFCLKASSYGLTPNCIYYVTDRLFGKVNLGDDDIVCKLGRSFAPYFIPPQSS